MGAADTFRMSIMITKLCPITSWEAVIINEMIMLINKIVVNERRSL
jgi:hypothetical protein